MLTVNIHQAKTNLSHYLDLVQKGKQVIIAKRNIPIAEIKLLKKKAKKRTLGGLKGKILISDSFFDPLPDEMLEAFDNPK